MIAGARIDVNVDVGDGRNDGQKTGHPLPSGSAPPPPPQTVGQRGWDGAEFVVNSEPMVMGADHGCENLGTQSGPLGDGVTRGTTSNTGGGSPGTSAGGQDWNQDDGRNTNTGNDSTGVE